MKCTVKRKIAIATFLPALGFPLATSSFAQGSGAQGSGQQQQQQQQNQAQQSQQPQAGKAAAATTIRDMRASKILGAKVQNAQGKDVGEVQDVIVDAGQGKAEYIVLAYGGTLGFNQKLFAYPVDRFQAASDGNKLVLNVSEQDMKNAPGFDRSKWPSWGSGGYRGQVDKHFGQTAKTGGNLVRMSQLVGKKVVDQAGNQVGDVNDVVVSITDGTVRFVTLDPVKDLNMGDRLAMLPMNTVQVTGEKQLEQQQQARQQQSGQTQSAQSGSQGSNQKQASKAQPKDQELVLVLNVPSTQVQQAPTIKKGEWPDLNNAQFRQELDNKLASFSGGSAAGGSASGASQTQGTSQAGTGAPATQSESASGNGQSNAPGQETGQMQGNGSSDNTAPGAAGSSR